MANKTHLSFRSSSVSSTVSDSSRGDTRQSSSNHILSSSQSPGSVGAQSRLQSLYGGASGRRGLRNTSGDSTQNGRSAGESARLARAERDEKTKSDVSSADSDRKRFGYSSTRPVSHPSGGSQHEKENSKGASATTGKVSALDLVAEKFGGIGLRRSLREKTDDDKWRFGNATTRRSARNVSGEISEKKDTRELSNLSRTQKTVIAESTETPIQLKGREIQKTGNIQVAARIESLKKNTQQDENKDRFGPGAVRRSVREAGGVGKPTESAKSDSKEREAGSGLTSSWQSKAKVSEKPKEQSSEAKSQQRELGSMTVEESSIKKTEKSAEAFGGSVLKRRLQKYSGQSKSSGVVEDILLAEQKHEDRHLQESAVDTPVHQSDLKVQSQKSFERIGKTPAADFLRRAEIRSSLRQHRRDVETSAEQTLSGDVFKRSSLRSTLPLRKDSNSDSLDRSETRRSLRKIDPARGRETSDSVDETHSAENVHPTGDSGVTDNVPVDESDEVFRESCESPVIKTKVSIEAQATDRFGRPAWRKSLRSREERPVSGHVEEKVQSPEITDEAPVSLAGKFVVDSQSHSTPNRSRIPKRSDSDSSAPDSHRTPSRSSEVLAQKTSSRFMMESTGSKEPHKSVTEKLDQGKKKLEASQPKNMPMSSVATPAKANQDVSVGDSFSETPSESREDRIKRYKAERRRQLAHLTERFQDSPVSKHFIKTEESKEEKSKDGLLTESATQTQKFVDTKTVHGFESHAGGAPLQQKAEHPEKEPQISKRPRSGVEPAECPEESASKRQKSDEEESAKVKTKVSSSGSKSKVTASRKAVDTTSRSNQVSSRSQRNPPLQVDADFSSGQTRTGHVSEMGASDSVDLKVGDRWGDQKEPTPESQQATLRYTLKDEVVGMPETGTKDLAREHSEAARGTKGTVEDSEITEVASKSMRKKVAEVKPFRQEPPGETSGVSVTSPPVRPESDKKKGAGMIEEQNVNKPERKAEIAVVKKVPEKEEIVRVARSIGKPVTKTTAQRENLPAEAPKHAPAEVKMVVKDKIKTSDQAATEAVDKNTAADITEAGAKLISQPEKLAVNITGTTAHLSPGKIEMNTTTGNVPDALVLKETKTKITKVTSTPAMETVPREPRTADAVKTESKQSSLQTKKDALNVKGKEAKVVTPDVVQERPHGSLVATEKKEDIVKTTPAVSDQPMAAVMSPKESQGNNQMTPSLAKQLPGMKESTTDSGATKTKVVADKITSVTAVASQGKKDSKDLQAVESEITVPHDKGREQVAAQADVTSEIKTPVKTLQQQQPESKTPESPDNLDELLRRNQKYLEEGVRKKLMRQQHVASSSSSEAEKAADGSLVPPGGKKKRISPLMRRRIKERSKSRERAEAEKEEAQE